MLLLVGGAYVGGGVVLGKRSGRGTGGGGGGGGLALLKVREERAN